MNISPKIAVFVAALASTCLTTSVYAVESASPSGEEVTESLKNRLKETINAVDEVSLDGQLVGYVGKVKDIVKNTIVVEDKSGKRNVVVDDATTIIRSPSTTIKLDSVRIGDAAIIMGSAIDNSETRGKRIIVSDTPFNPPLKVTGLARVAKVTSSGVTVATVPDNQTTVLSLSAKSIVKSPQGTLDSTDLENGDLVIYSALVDTKDSAKLTATVIMRIKDANPDIVPSPTASPKSQ